VALRPRLSPGVPLSRNGTTDLGSGTGTVKHRRANSWTGAHLKSRWSVAELQVRGQHPQGAVLPGIQEHVGWRQRQEHVRRHLLDHAGPLRGHAGMFPGECGGTRAQR
jgi:hypothetical protein